MKYNNQNKRKKYAAILAIIIAISMVISVAVPIATAFM